MKKITFITHENIEKTAVAKAMFYDLVINLKDKYKCHFVSAGDKKNEFVDDNGIKRINFPRKHQGKISLIDFFNIFGSFFVIIKSIYNSDVLYIRSYPMMILFAFWARLFRVKVVFDTRGLFFEELYDSGKMKNVFIRRLFSHLEYLLLRISTKVICVSEEQMNYYSDIFSKEELYIVFYNASKPTSNLEILPDNGTLKIGYVGSLIKWHCPDLMFEIMSALNDKCTDVEFHCVTRDIDSARHFFSGLDNVKIYSHDYRNRPIKFDLGICLIEDTISKKVCFPVKFSEYLSAKTPVMYSNNVRVCDEIASKIYVGFGVSLSESAESIADKIIDFSRRNTNFNKVELPDFLMFDSVSVRVEDMLGSI
ncbi:hypothetical protein NQO50_002542 [Vibrio vulnificus]|uniref:hypothetical protein n=1 Tax=Vibrio vulnificus TaxID=672 RepID=UPI0018657D94|nr:hypothetical protein [Vibrio vulnificus]EGR7943728.1 glycosyltransferase family 4 protein [Vibrio vulnificus]EHY0956596.1 hypothetical protein [Vibrio vulnificus]EIU7747086.1 hypothetical protein [Vibrio vulnificus]EJN6716216.1 hypothetical protein [Vibrio vulnificus]EKY4881212.1 hypothetical protein [Vibrio vulnificus]